MKSVITPLMALFLWAQPAHALEARLASGLSFKEDVIVEGIQPETIRAISAAYLVYLSHGAPLVVTSVTDGEHRKNSPHYAGLAVDLRTRHLPTGMDKVIRLEASRLLGDSYTVIVETDPPHLHIEYAPK